MKRRNLVFILGGLITPARASHAQQKAMPVIGCPQQRVGRTVLHRLMAGFLPGATTKPAMSRDET